MRMPILKNIFSWTIIPTITLLMVLSLWVLSNLELNNVKNATLPPEKILDKIAYIGHGKQLYTINPDGSKLTKISNEDGSSFSWPT